MSPYRILFALGHKYADAAHPLRLLRPRHYWPDRRSTNSTENIPPPHALTSAFRDNSMSPAPYRYVTATLETGMSRSMLN